MFNFLLNVSGASVSGVMGQVTEGFTSLLSMAGSAASFITATGIVMIFLIYKLAPRAITFFKKILDSIRK